MTEHVGRCQRCERVIRKDLSRKTVDCSGHGKAVSWRCSGCQKTVPLYPSRSAEAIERVGVVPDV